MPDKPEDKMVDEAKMKNNTQSVRSASPPLLLSHSPIMMDTSPLRFTSKTPDGGDADDLEAEISKLDENFNELTTYLEQLDGDDGSNFMPIILSLTPAQLMEKLKAIENYSVNLGFEEARQMQRGRVLNIFGASSSSPTIPITPVNSGPIPTGPSKASSSSSSKTSSKTTESKSS